MMNGSAASAAGSRWPARDYDAAAMPRGANFVGSPQQIVEKVLFQHELFDHDRFLCSSRSARCRTPRSASIELLGTEVAPAVRAAVASHV